MFGHCNLLLERIGMLPLMGKKFVICFKWTPLCLVSFDKLFRSIGDPYLTCLTVQGNVCYQKDVCVVLFPSNQVVPPRSSFIEKLLNFFLM